MKFSLVTDVPVSFSVGTRSAGRWVIDADGVVRKPTRVLFGNAAAITSDATPNVSINNRGEFWDAGIVRKCADAVSKMINMLTGDSENLMGMSTRLVLPEIGDAAALGSSCNLELNIEMSIDNGKALEYLLKSFGDKMRIKLEVYFKRDSKDNPTMAAIMSYMKIRDQQCQDRVRVTKIMRSFWLDIHSRNESWAREIEVPATFNILLPVDDNADLFAEFLNPDPLACYLTLVLDAILRLWRATELSFDARNASCLVIDNSKLGKKVTEAITNRMEMRDTSEAGVDALLRFLLFGDLQQPKENVELALELLKNAYEYEILRLQPIMRSMLLMKQDVYFNVQAARELLRIATQFQLKELSEKALGIIMMEEDD